MQLLPVVLYAEIQSDVVLPQIFHLEQACVDIAVESIKDDHFPEVFPLAVDLLEERTLLDNQVGLGRARLHLWSRGYRYNANGQKTRINITSEDHLAEFLILACFCNLNSCSKIYVSYLDLRYCFSCTVIFHSSRPTA